MDNKEEELNKLVKQLEDLQIQQEAVIKKIRASTEVPQAGDRSAQDNTDPFQVGQRVLIKNRLGKILSSLVSKKPSIKNNDPLDAQFYHRSRIHCCNR